MRKWIRKGVISWWVVLLGAVRRYLRGSKDQWQCNNDCWDSIVCAVIDGGGKLILLFEAFCGVDMNYVLMCMWLHSKLSVYNYQFETSLHCIIRWLTSNVFLWLNCEEPLVFDKLKHMDISLGICSPHVQYCSRPCHMLQLAKTLAPMSKSGCDKQCLMLWAIVHKCWLIRANRMLIQLGALQRLGCTSHSQALA